MPPEATLLPPPPSANEDDLESRESARTLDDVGAYAVLGAMIEQRRKSQPFLDAHVLAESAEGGAGGDDGQSEDEQRVVTKSGVQARGPVRRHSEGFLKVR